MTTTAELCSTLRTSSILVAVRPRKADHNGQKGQAAGGKLRLCAIRSTSRKYSRSRARQLFRSLTVATKAVEDSSSISAGLPGCKTGAVSNTTGVCVIAMQSVLLPFLRSRSDHTPVPQGTRFAELCLRSTTYFGNLKRSSRAILPRTIGPGTDIQLLEGCATRNGTYLASPGHRKKRSSRDQARQPDGSEQNGSDFLPREQ